MLRLMNIQQKLKAPKNQRNNFGNYNYRSAEDILEAVKPILKEEKCVIVIGDEIVSVVDRVYVKATARLISAEDGKEIASTSALAREPSDKKGQDDSQLTGATSSYARKYALNGLLCIDDTKDADALNKHGKEDDAPTKPAKKELTKEEKDAEIKKKVDEMCNRISKSDKVIVDSNEYNTYISFAQKIDNLGYKYDAGRLIEAVESKSFKDEMPRFE